MGTITANEGSTKLEGSSLENHAMEGDFASIAQAIAELGYAVVSLEVEAPGGPLPFSFTVGLCGRGFPELMVFGIPCLVAKMLLDEGALRLAQGLVGEGDPVEGMLAGLPVIFKRVSVDAVEGMRAMQEPFALGRQLQMLQIAWPDRHGFFPWDDRFDEGARGVQPIFGECFD